MIVRKLAGSLTLLAAVGLLQPLSAQAFPDYTWDPERPDARAPISVTEDRVLPKGGFQLGLRYLYNDMRGQGYGTDSLTTNQVLTLFDVSPSEMASQGFALDLVYGVADRFTLSATGTFAQKTRRYPGARYASDRPGPLDIVVSCPAAGRLLDTVDDPFA